MNIYSFEITARTCADAVRSLNVQFMANTKMNIINIETIEDKGDGSPVTIRIWFKD